MELYEDNEPLPKVGKYILVLQMFNLCRCFCKSSWVPVCLNRSMWLFGSLGTFLKSGCCNTAFFWSVSDLSILLSLIP